MNDDLGTPIYISDGEDDQTGGKDSPIVIDELSDDIEHLINFHDLNSNIEVVLYKDSERFILDPSFWLCDSHIHAAQKLLKIQFPHVDGLDSPTIQGELVTPAVSEFIQIINTGGHWVCLTSIGCAEGTVKVLGSLYNKPSSIAVKHACRLLMHQGEHVIFQQEKVQKQTNFSDCGQFVIAFATDLCYGLDPKTYEQGKLRQHYVKCLKQERMEPFPTVNRRVPRHQTTSNVSVPVYCTCRMPNDDKIYGQCDTCDG